MSQHALSQYRQVNTAARIEDASPHKLIQMLMQGCLGRLAEGKGAVAFEGDMIDKPIVDRARRLIARAG